MKIVPSFCLWSRLRCAWLTRKSSSFRILRFWKNFNLFTILDSSYNKWNRPLFWKSKKTWFWKRGRYCWTNWFMFRKRRLAD
jgi:hypothetical protein